MRRRPPRRAIAVLGLLALAVVALLALAACGGDDDDDDAATPETTETSGAGDTSGGEPSGDPILIGAVKAESGFMSAFDIPPLRGAELAVADINAAGGVLGRPLEISVIDYHSKPEDAGPAAQELIDDGASLIIAACDFDLGSPAALVAQEANVLAMSDCAGSIQFGVQGIGPLAYTMGNAGRSEGAIMAEWAYNERNMTKAWTLRDTNLLYYSEVCTGFKDRFTELGGTIVGEETFETDDPTIATQISALESAETPDFLFICGFPTGGAGAIRQLRSAGFDQPLLSSNTYDGTYWMEAVPDISNMYFSNYASMWGDDPNPEVNAFFEQYQEQYGSLPDNSNVITGYSLIQAFALAAESAGTLEGDALANALDTMGEMDLLVGPTTFTPDLHIDLLRRQEIMEIQDSQPKFLQYWELTTPPKVDF